jgi:hypothetical protein
MDYRLRSSVAMPAILAQAVAGQLKIRAHFLPVFRWRSHMICGRSTNSAKYRLLSDPRD